MYLGIDIGTTSAKCVLLSPEGEVIQEDISSYSLTLSDGVKVEQDPENWWNAVCIMLNRISKKHSLKHLKGLCISGHACSLVMMDKQGTVLSPVISCLDARAYKEMKFIKHNVESLIREINGNGFGLFNFESKLLWVKKNLPEVYKNIYKILSPTGYINYKLTNKWTGNISDMGISACYNRKKSKEWSKKCIEAIGLDINKYPKLYNCDEVIGYVTKEATKETNLPEGVAVIAGGEDTSSAAYGLGVINPRDAYMSLGSQGTVGVCTGQYSIQPEILGFPHVITGKSLLNGSMSTCGLGITWFTKNFCGIDKLCNKQSDLYSELSELVKNSNPGANGLLFLPYMSGALHPYLDENAMGCFWGITLEHTRADFARSVFEGMGFDIKTNLEYAEKVSGEVNIIYATGGPTKSKELCQIIADVTDKIVVIRGPKGAEGGAAFGDAVLAMCSLSGTDIEYINSFLENKYIYKPREEYREMYENQYSLFKRIYYTNKENYIIRKNNKSKEGEIVVC